MTVSPALTVGERLLDPATTIDAVGEADAASLSRGLAGTALLHARLSAVDPKFATAAIHHWTKAAAHLRRHPSRFTGIQGGQGGLAASLIIGSTYLPAREHIRTTAARSAKWLSACAVDLADQYRTRPTAIGTQWHLYDAITGLAGIGRVLLAASQDGHTGVEHGLKAAMETLTTLLGPQEIARPGWWLSAEYHPPGVSVDASGAATTGLAHGVAGPLALLSTAHISGWGVPSQADSIANAVTWLLAWRSPDGTWPPHITGTELDNHAPAQQAGRRDAWCYGTPGITRALHIASRALNKPGWANEADKTLEHVADRPPDEWDTDGPTLCHGYAGVMQATARTSPPIADAAATAVANTFDPTADFGFQHHDGAHTHNEPGFLTGASGVALALADHADLPTSGSPIHWDCLLNLS
ncbi:MAG TPA: lanthionine synthetase C family protein [Mycobacteriales bacterium]|nr:lanthionine synthetase C family protein [Mycobacteriales bacterium]